MQKLNALDDKFIIIFKRFIFMKILEKFYVCGNNFCQFSVSLRDAEHGL